MVNPVTLGEVEAQGFLTAARTRLAERRFDLAYPLLERAVLADPSSVPASVNLLGVSMQGGGIRDFLPQVLNVLAPDNPTVLLNKAEALRDAGAGAEANVWFRRALVLRPDAARGWLKLSSFALKHARSEAFRSNLTRAFMAEPRKDDVAGLMAAVLLDEGLPAAALEILEGPIGDTIPADGRGTMRIRALIKLRRTDEAIALIDELRESKPLSASLWTLRSYAGRASPDQGNATIDGLRAVLVDPSFGEAWQHLGMAFLTDDQPQAGVMGLRRLCLISPDAIAWTEDNLAAGLLGLGRREEAVPHLKRSLLRNPAKPETWSNLSTALMGLQDLPAARRMVGRALLIDPKRADAVYNLALLERFDRNHAAARIRIHEALALEPENPNFNFTFSSIELADGDIERGLHAHHYRWRMKKFAAVRGMYPEPALPVPVWKGERLSGTLAVWGEQGVGDEMWFAAYLQHAVDLADRVILEITPHLLPLMRRSFPSVRVFPRFARQTEAALRRADAQIPMGDLFEMFFDQGSPVRTGYLKSDKGTVSTLRQRYLEGAEPGTRLVGLSWRSRKSIVKRSFEAPIAHWGDVLDTGADSAWEGRPMRFVCLQYGDVSDDLAIAADLFEARILYDDSVDPLTDLDRAAAQLEAMDMVISVANSTVALAHGLGLPCVVPTRIDQDDWRYPRLSPQSRWFPLMRHVWQETPLDWRPALKKAASIAAKLMPADGR